MGPTADVLYRIKRGLSGYISYLAACEMNQSFSEYVLYEPMLRILTARRYTVQCECPCPGFVKHGAGDYKKLDFVAIGDGIPFAIEVKWARRKRLSIATDVGKLRRYRESSAGARAFLCVFGKKSVLYGLSLKMPGLREQGNAVYAEFGVTRYGCRTYEVTD